MAGYLDKSAPSVEAEYIGYLDGDILGKMVLKNFLLNIARIPERHISIPLGRHGDAALKNNFDGDALISNGGQKFTIEVKVSRVTFRHHNRQNPNASWMFSQLTHTQKTKKLKRFDILFAVGVMLPSFGSFRDLSYLNRIVGSMPHSFSRDDWAFPHNEDFLERCGFFIIPRAALYQNSITPTIRTISESPWSRWFSWGIEPRRCSQLWKHVIRYAQNKDDQKK